MPADGDVKQVAAKNAKTTAEQLKAAKELAANTQAYGNGASIAMDVTGGVGGASSALNSVATFVSGEGIEALGEISKYAGYATQLVNATKVASDLIGKVATFSAGTAAPAVPAPPSIPTVADAPKAPEPSLPVPSVAPLAEGVAALALDKPPAAEVRVHFEARNTLSGALDGISWNVQDLHLDEDLGEPFELLLEVQTGKRDSDPSALVGADAFLTISREFDHLLLVRPLCGVIRSVSHLDVDPGQLHLRLEIVPAFSMLKQQRTFRIYQDKTAKEILLDVLKKELSQYRRKVDLSTLTPDDKYPKREYCVQFEESDFAFCSRLMEEEGITYHFATDDDGHEVMTLVDDNKNYQRIQTPDGRPTPILYRQGEMSEFEALSAFHGRSSAVPTGLLAKDWNWTVPSTTSAWVDEIPVDARNRARVQQSTQEITHYEYKGLKYEKNDGTRQGDLQKRLQQIKASICFGSGFVTQFRPGMIVELTGHRQPGFDGEYLITRVVHSRVGSDDKRFSYVNEFEVIPLSVPFVPDRIHKKNRIFGLQTAKVIGPAGEEIHTDEHGRVNVQFYWDNHFAAPDEVNRTCWVRVRQNWAHNGWGDLFIPYIGMEAVVSFLNGDPDRPLVIGTVYNGENRPPQDLPGSKMSSGTRTIRGNEVSFNDTSGGERVFINATKDLKEVVGNDHSTEVTANQTNCVGGSQTITVESDQAITVAGGSRTVDVKTGGELITIKGTRKVTVQGGEQHFDVTGTHKVTASGQVSINAPEIVLQAGKSSIKMTDGRIVLDSGLGTTLELAGHLHAQGTGGAVMTLTDSGFLQAKNGTGFVAQGNLAIASSKTGSYVAIEGPVEVSSASGGVTKVETGVFLGGNVVHAKATNKVLCEAPSSKMCVDGNATLEGTEATITGTAMATLAGPAASVTCDAALSMTAPMTNIG